MTSRTYQLSFRVILFFSFAFISAEASDVPGLDSTDKPVCTISFGLDISNNRTYKGTVRSDTNTAYTSPYFSYTSRKNITLSFSTINFLGSKDMVDETNLGISYDFKMEGKYSGSVAYTYSYYNPNSKQLTSSLPNDVNVYIKRKGSWLRSKLVMDLAFGNQSPDVGITYSNYHSFDKEFDNGNELSFTPKIYILMGSINYLKTFLTKQEQKKLKKGGDIPSKDLNTKFKINALEFFLPISFTRKHFTLEGTWQYSIPLNQPKIAALKTQPSSTFLLSIYWTFEKE